MSINITCTYCPLSIVQNHIVDLLHHVQTLHKHTMSIHHVLCPLHISYLLHHVHTLHMHIMTIHYTCTCTSCPLSIVQNHIAHLLHRVHTHAHALTPPHLVTCITPFHCTCINTTSSCDLHHVFSLHMHKHHLILRPTSRLSTAHVLTPPHLATYIKPFHCTMY
jgi:hypothetical protein